MTVRNLRVVFPRHVERKKLPTFGWFYDDTATYIYRFYWALAAKGWIKQSI